MMGMPSFPTAPPGLEAIYCACKRTYPDQSNPLQVTALVKYWLGGPDPLDYISMYTNPGDPTRNIPPHWHYVSFGLSDLHGDGRVHDLQQQGGDSSTSGFGFELTFRLKKEPTESSPPTWPAALMQALARYVFQSENILCCGDHVSWHAPLDASESRIQHMLMAEDPQLAAINSPFGKVTFIQIVGVCLEELQASQQWNGLGVLELMRETASAGGLWLLTDMQRARTIFEINPRLTDKVEEGIVSEGSNLSGVSARCAWDEATESDWEDDDDDDDANVPINRNNSTSTKNQHSKPHNPMTTNNSNQPLRRSQQQPQHDSDPNEDIEDSDEFDEEDDDVPLGAEGVFPESDSEDETNSAMRHRLMLPNVDSNDSSAANTSGEATNETRRHGNGRQNKQCDSQQKSPSLSKGKQSRIKNSLMKGLSKSSLSSSNNGAKNGTSLSGTPSKQSRTNGKNSSSFSVNSASKERGRCSSKASKCSSQMDTESLGSSTGAKMSLAPGDRFLENGIHLKFNLEAGTLLLLAFRGRLRHGRHFTFKSVLGDVAITFVTPNIVGALCTEEHPYAAHGPWLQVLLMEHMLNDIQGDLETALSDAKNPPVLPKTFRWPENRLSITIVSEET